MACFWFMCDELLSFMLLFFTIGLDFAVRTVVVEEEEEKHCPCWDECTTSVLLLGVLQ